jgi:hypothetical protein
MQHLNNLQAQRRAPPTMPRPLPSQRLPENINQQINRPTDKSAATRQATNTVNPRNLPPPSGLPHTSPHLRPSPFSHHLSPQQQQQQQQQQRITSPGMPYPHHNNQQLHQQQQQQQQLSYGSAPDVTLPSSTSNRLKQAGKSLPKLGPDVSFYSELLQMDLLHIWTNYLLCPKHLT